MILTQAHGSDRHVAMDGASKGAVQGSAARVEYLDIDCPFCWMMTLRRRKRTGFLEQKILSKLGYFPWNCNQCRETIYLRFRGEPKPIAPTQP